MLVFLPPIAIRLAFFVKLDVECLGEIHQSPLNGSNTPLKPEFGHLFPKFLGGYLAVAWNAPKQFDDQSDFLKRFGVLCHGRQITRLLRPDKNFHSRTIARVSRPQ